ncbi:MAG: winged helix-turn-helix domain-containing protein [Archaeoglobaceae archaeon]|nr:winged helix-turn-helix domain-containing protein [Archaeoglobaceae archaeon]
MRDLGEISKGKILLAIKSGARFFSEIEELSGVSSGIIGKHLRELEKEGLIVVELDQKRRRPRYKLNEAKRDEIEEVIKNYLEYEKKEVKEKLKLLLKYATLTEEERKVIEVFLKN